MTPTQVTCVRTSEGHLVILGFGALIHAVLFSKVGAYLWLLRVLLTIDTEAAEHERKRAERNLGFFGSRR